MPVPNNDDPGLLLRLSLTPGLGPVLIDRLLERFGSAADRVSPAELTRIRGIGEAKARVIAEGMKSAAERAEREIHLATKLGVSIVAKGSPQYPALLGSLPDSPAVLYVRGTLLASDVDRFAVAIVGSRRCSSYGLEQASLFGSVLARAGLCVVSGGARGIDSAAHRGAITAGGRTVAVLGCGLCTCYPPENATLFDKIAGAGAVVSELPLETPPQADNFPARNRIISGLSLGVVVIEAGRNSGALITARQAVEDHGREVMVVPGRVDSAASEGSLQLLKAGGAHLVTDPGDVIQVLESAARHLHGGTHEARFSTAASVQTPLFEESGMLSGTQAKILRALDSPLTLDELVDVCDLDAAALRQELTLLEIQKRVVREGGRLARRK